MNLRLSYRKGGEILFASLAAAALANAIILIETLSFTGTNYGAWLLVACSIVALLALLSMQGDEPKRQQ